MPSEDIPQPVASDYGRPNETLPTALLRMVANRLPVGIFCKDALDEFRIVVWNAKNAEIHGIAEEDALEKTDFDLFNEDDAARFRKNDERVISEDKELEFKEERVWSERLGEVILHTRKVPIHTPDGAVKYVLGISEDITEQAKTEERILDAMDQLVMKNKELENVQYQLIQAEKLESIGRLAAGVAHEVKNPLALLLMGVEYLEQGIDPGDTNLPSVLAEMRDAVDRADHIVRGLVDFSSSHQLSRTPCSIENLINSSLVMVRHELKKVRVKVEQNLDSDLPDLDVDKTKFGQVLVNLLMNASHALAIRKQEGEGRIRVSARLGEFPLEERADGDRSSGSVFKGKDAVILEFHDNGPGFSSDALAKIFDPFFTTKVAGMGTGLGMTVVKKIIDLHNGNIEALNHEEGGALIRIHIPLAKQQT